MKNNLLLIGLCALFLISCDKKNAYMPTVISPGSIQAQSAEKIQDINSNIAKTSSGYIGPDFKAQSSLPVLARHANAVLLAQGQDIVLDDGSFKASLEQQPASANFDENFVCVVDKGNKISIFNRQNSRLLIEQEGQPSYGVDAAFASPIFYENLIIAPSLDGNVHVFDMTVQQGIFELQSGYDNFFNNIILLAVEHDRLIISSHSKLLSFNLKTKALKDFGARISFAKIRNSQIYLALNSGDMKKLDLDLNELKSKEFRFANFKDFAVGDRVFALEEQGYLISTNLELEDLRVYKEKLKGLSFSNNSAFYFNSKSLPLK